MTCDHAFCSLDSQPTSKPISPPLFLFPLMIFLSVYGAFLRLFPSSDSFHRSWDADSWAEVRKCPLTPFTRNLRFSLNPHSLKHSHLCLCRSALSYLSFLFFLLQKSGNRARSYRSRWGFLERPLVLSDTFFSPRPGFLFACSPTSFLCLGADA